ncbi:MAG: hypothetical protein ACXWQR_09985 [Ktedonobacterales bacterium]
MPTLAEIPIAVVTAEASPFTGAAPTTIVFLTHAGATVGQVHLPDCGMHGNGHGLIFERNSDDVRKRLI